MIRRRITFCLSLIGLVVFLLPEPEATGASLQEQMIEMAKKEGEVVMAGSSADRHKELMGFRKKYPFINLRAISTDTAATINRITAEASAGKLSTDLPDVGNDGAEILAKAGLLVKQDFPHLRDFIPGHQPSHGLYVNILISSRPQGVYNTKLVSPSELPKSWDDMTDPKWTGKTMVSMSEDDLPAKLAWLWRKGEQLNWERSFDFFERLAKQKLLIARSYRGGMEQLAAGEKAIFWFGPLGSASPLFFQGASLGLIAFPKMLGQYRSSGVLKAARHPAAAWLLIDYLTSPEGQFEYTDVMSSKVILNKKAKSGKHGRWGEERGVTAENTAVADAEGFFDKAVQTKSEAFFSKLLGIK